MSEIAKLLSDGQRSLNLDNPKEALSFYQKVLDQNPAHLEALLKKGNIFGKNFSKSYLVFCKKLLIFFVFLILFFKLRNVFEIFSTSFNSFLLSKKFLDDNANLFLFLIVLHPITFI